MAQTINADDGSVSGSAGLKSSSDGTAVLELQTKGTTAVSVSASQVVTVNGLVIGKGGGAVSTNTALGVSALGANEAGGTNNTAVGYQALDANTTGDANTAIGDSALGANTTASNNTAVGYQAAYSNTTGTPNTAVGRKALYTNSTGNDNAAFGDEAMYFNTTGSNNTAIGSDALQLNTTGGNNTALGFRSLYNNTTASNSTAVGYQAGYKNTAANNTFIGMYSGYDTTSGSNNTFVGYGSGFNTTGGTGSYNTFIGESAGYLTTSGSKNTIIGRYNGNQGSLDIRTSSNYIVLSDGDGNPRGYWTNAGTLVIPQTYNDTTANAANMEIDSGGVVRRSTSSLRYKTDVKDATHGLADVLKLRSVTYKGKNDGDKVFGGLIAEEVHDAGLTEFVVYDKDGKPDALAYGNMVSVLVKAIQEQQAMIDDLKAKVAALEGA